ncbi:MAG TPA: DEAD/DEAH box helicase, partial [Anaerolineaceae bacterium]|nr:DEAD/DEAH box helicase [Anaerolineaceae bacterium]
MEMDAMQSKPHGSVGPLISAWRADPSIGGNVVAWETAPAQPARVEDFPPEISPPLRNALERLGIPSLYIHQAEAWRQIRAGQHLVVSTGTASGKTMCYNLPVIDSLLRSGQGRALYIFPTKALAQDQKNNLARLLEVIDPRDLKGYPPGQVTVGVYDGDTPSDLRASIRGKAQIVITNPDMLHTGILPHHTLWAEFFRNLRFVVVDEMHIYRGVFGSHVANVIRRLKRLAQHYGAQPQFILTSATIANPIELSSRLVEEQAMLISEDGSARGARHFLIFNPPVVDKDLGLRRSSLLESVRLAKTCLTYDIQTIIFGRSRRTVELVLSYLRDSFPGAENRIRGYRSGYLSLERRAIEQGLRSETVDAVVATNALELGIDIGGMGASLMVGYPGSIAATWQQAGRAGRKAGASLAVLIASADALDQFLAHHPDYFFSRPIEQALVNPDNLLILLQHLQCAAFELPFQRGEGFGRVPQETVDEFLRYLEDSSVL